VDGVAVTDAGHGSVTRWGAPPRRRRIALPAMGARSAADSFVVLRAVLEVIPMTADAYW
jgi:hypothetical protein